MNFTIGEKYVLHPNPNGWHGNAYRASRLHGKSFTYTGTDGNRFDIFNGLANEYIKYKPGLGMTSATTSSSGIFHVSGGKSYRISGLFFPGQSVDPPIVSPPTPPDVPTKPTENPCYNFDNYGISLAEHTFVWKEEARKFMARPEVAQISTMNSKTMGIYQDTLLERDYWKFRGDINGMRVICTNHMIKDLACFIEHAKYDAVPEYDVFIAKFKIPDAMIVQHGGLTIDRNVRLDSFADYKGQLSPDGYYYVTEQGHLCFFEKSIEEDPTNTGGPVDPVIPDDPITPDTPIVGAGQTHAPISDKFDSYEQSTSPLWPDNAFNVDTLFADYNSETIDFCLSVFDKVDTDDCRRELFKIIYGDFEGKGAIDLGGYDDETLTKAMYTQYANILLPSGQEKFIINGVEQDAVYIMDVSRKLYVDGIDPGNFEFSFQEIVDSNADPLNPTDHTNITSDPGGFLTVVDEYVHNQNKPDLKQPVSIKLGNLEDGITANDEYGILYPSMGIFVFRTDIITETSGSNYNHVREIQKSCFNPVRFFHALVSKSIATTNNYVDASGDFFGFKARNIVFKHVRFAYVRLKNYQFNFSNNPTYTKDEDGSILDTMLGDSKVYITSVGLYNSKKELLAVGKLSQPMLKSACEEAVLTIKIEQ